MDNILEKLTIIDTETTSLNMDLVEICEIAAGKFTADGFKINSELRNTKVPIPFDASAQNHISRKMLEGKPLFGSNLNSENELIFIHVRRFSE